ncbi:MAG: hypothetical protein AAFP90_12425, partial [Planctomycetota bacterium]
MSISVYRQPLRDVVQAIASAAGVAVVWRADGVAVFGSSAKSDAVVFVRRVTRGTKEEIASVVAAVTGGSGKSTVTDDGLAIVYDTAEHVSSLSQAF